MHFQPGDIAACYGTDWSSRAISYGTAALFAPGRLHLGPSHVAMLCEYRESIVWVESTNLCREPCLIRRRRVSGAQAQWPSQRIRDYVGSGGRVDVYRLSPIDRFDFQESLRLSELLVRHFVLEEVNYDFGGALLSGTRVFQWSRLFPGADLSSLFCSEFLSAVLMRLGRMNRANSTRYNPARLLRELVREGTYQFEGQADMETA